MVRVCICISSSARKKNVPSFIYFVFFCYYTGGCSLCLIHVNCTSILGVLADIESLGGTRLFKILQVMQGPVKGNFFNFALIFCLFTAIFSPI